MCEAATLAEGALCVKIAYPTCSSQNRCFGGQDQLGNSTNSWTVGNSVAISGTIATDYVDGSSIQFLAGQGKLVGVANPTVNFIPNPGTASPNPGFGNPTSGPTS